MGCNLLSRSVALAGGEDRVIFSPQFPPGKRYRLSISETLGTGRALITVELLHAQNAQKMQFSVGPNGGEAIALSGSAVISALSQAGPINLNCDITEPMPGIDLVTFQELSNVLGAAYVDLGTNGGFPQAHYNYAAIYLTAAADLRLVSMGGAVVWEDLAANPSALLFNQFRIGCNQRLQARGVGVTATVAWYNRR